MRYRQIAVIIGVFTLIAGGIACTINVGGPSYPLHSIPVSTEALGNLQSAVETAITNGAESGTVTLIFTESELSSYLSYTLQAQRQQFITYPQVYLRDNEIQVYGTAAQGYFVATVRIVFSAGVDEQGQLKIKLTSANFGPLPVPNSLTDVATASIQEAYTGALGPVATGFRLQSVNIIDGSMTIVGQIK
jgi:hypothetical protein